MHLFTLGHTVVIQNLNLSSIQTSKLFFINFLSSSSDLTPVEEPEKEAVRSPKRQSSSSTVYDRVRAKLSRSLSTSNTSVKVSTLKATEEKKKENLRRLSTGKIVGDPSCDFENVKFRSPSVLRNGRRCHSELTSASTAELLAQFVASRLNEKPTLETSKSLSTKIHTPLPRSTEETTRPIMSIHKETGILQVSGKFR